MSGINYSFFDECLNDEVVESFRYLEDLKKINAKGVSKKNIKEAFEKFEELTDIFPTYFKLENDVEIKIIAEVVNLRKNILNTINEAKK